MSKHARMTIRPLPPRVEDALVCYLNGEIDHDAPIGEAIAHVTKVLRSRRNQLLQLVKVDPSQAWNAPDFWELLRQRIQQHMKKRIRPAITADPDGALTASPLFKTAFHKRLTQTTHNGKVTKRGQKRAIARARRFALNDCMSNPRAIGELESFALGTCVFGIPPSHLRVVA